MEFGNHTDNNHQDLSALNDYQKLQVVNVDVLTLICPNRLPTITTETGKRISSKIQQTLLHHYK